MSAPGHWAIRLVSPLVCLLLLLGARAVLPDMAPELPRVLGQDTAGFLDLALAIGAWLAGAALLVRMLDAVVWRHRSPPVPRLLTDLVGAAIWIAAVLIGAQTVLALPLMGILTTSGVVVAVGRSAVPASVVSPSVPGTVVVVVVVGSVGSPDPPSGPTSVEPSVGSSGLPGPPGPGIVVVVTSGRTEGGAVVFGDVSRVVGVVSGASPASVTGGAPPPLGSGVVEPPWVRAGSGTVVDGAGGGEKRSETDEKIRCAGGGST